MGTVKVAMDQIPDYLKQAWGNDRDNSYTSQVLFGTPQTKTFTLEAPNLQFFKIQVTKGCVGFT